MSLFLTAEPSVPGVSPVGVAVKMVPVPSSLMVPVPLAVVPPVLVARSSNVSPLSATVSLVIAVRTRSLPLAFSATLAPAV